MSRFWIWSGSRGSISGPSRQAPVCSDKYPYAGRPKGAKNVMPRALKDSIVRAAAEKSARKPDKPVEPSAYRTPGKVRAAPIARGVSVRQVDMMRGTQSSNVIDGPFKKRGS